MLNTACALNAPPTECLCCNHVCRQRSNSGEQACSGMPYPRISPHFPPVFPRFPPFSPIFPHFPPFSPIFPIFPIFPWPKKDLETPGWETSKAWTRRHSILCVVVPSGRGQARLASGALPTLTPYSDPRAGDLDVV